MSTIVVPDYQGGSIVNLVSEIELRLGGTPPSPGLSESPAGLIPDASGYVLVVFDGLGSAQLEHPDAAALRGATAASIDTVFPATTTVALASLATGLAPSRHGLLGYQLWMQEVDAVVNTIKWTTLWGRPVEFDTSGLLPGPNLWERLSDIGIATSTVQPAHFDRSPLSRALYRGCRFEPADDTKDLVERTAAVAGPGRLVLTYVPHVDFAAHVGGQRSPEYAEAISVAAAVWSGIANAVPVGVAVLGTADHGHVDYPAPAQHEIPRAAHQDRVFYGDSRAMFVKGDAADLAARLPATWIAGEDAAPWWGPGPVHASFSERAPDGVLLADDDAVVLHRFSDRRLIGHHGAMTAAEQKVPLLVRA